MEMPIVNPEVKIALKTIEIETLNEHQPTLELQD